MRPSGETSANDVGTMTRTVPESDSPSAAGNTTDADVDSPSCVTCAVPRTRSDAFARAILVTSVYAPPAAASAPPARTTSTYVPVAGATYFAIPGLLATAGQRPSTTSACDGS